MFHNVHDVCATSENANWISRPTHRFVQHGGDKVVSNSLYFITAFAMVI